MSHHNEWPKRFGKHILIDGNPRATTLIALTVLGALGVDVSGAGELMDLPVLGGGVPVGEIAVGRDLESWLDERRAVAR